MPVSDVVKALPKESINLALLFASVGVEGEPTANSFYTGRSLNDQLTFNELGEKLPADFPVEPRTLTARLQSVNTL
jgi:hypothetical protein